MLTLCDGRRLSYAEYGDPSGVPVIFCHGVPGSRADGRSADASASALGVRLVVPERPGYGASDPVADAGFRRHTVDVLALVDALKLHRPALIGFSGGGPFAMALAAALGQQARKLVLVGSLAPFADGVLLGAMSERSRQLFTLAAGDRIELEVAFAGVTADSRALAAASCSGSPADRALFDDAELRSVYESSCALALNQGPAAIFSDLALLTRPWDFDLREITCPVTLWHGAADENVPPAMSEALASMIPGARLKRLPDAGHWFLWRRWRDVLATAV